MGFSKEREELMTPRQKKDPEPESGKPSTKKEKLDWDKIDAMGEGENPLDEKKSLQELLVLGVILVACLIVFCVIWKWMGFPLLHR